MNRAHWALLFWVVGCGPEGGRTPPPPEAAVDLAPGVSPLPLVAPMVWAATPSGLLPSHSRRGPGPLALPANDFKERFFSSGPTDIFAILRGLDQRIEAINTLLATSPPDCFQLAPMPYLVSAGGRDVLAWAQCWQAVGSSMAGDPGFLQVGRKDGVTYFYSAIGQGRILAVIQSVGMESHVEVWMSVGTLNAAGGCGATWRDCSYGLIHLAAIPSGPSFEMGVAGLGFGYCGAQLRSDGNVIFAAGSADMGQRCNDIDTLCVAVADAITPAECGEAVSSFSLEPIGREQGDGFGASQYPASAGGLGNLYFDGSDADAAHFGPIVPTQGSDNMWK